MTYQGEELQRIINDLIIILPDVAKTDVDLAPILEAVRALTVLKDT